MSRSWRFFAHPFLLPFTIGYALFVLVVYRAGYWRMQDGVVTCIASSFERAITPKGPYQTVTRIWGRPGAQTIGALTVFADEHERARQDLRVHEHTHIVQQTLFALGGVAVVPPVFIALGIEPLWSLALSGFIGAAAYAIAYVAFFLVAFALVGFRDWKAAYHDNPFEKWAYEEQADYMDMRPVDKARVWGHR